ncbi:MAG: hypothetical protein ACKOC6_09855, partial [bacterium]
PHAARDPRLLRVGTPALTTRGMGMEEMRLVGGWIARVLDRPDDASVTREVAAAVRELADGYPLFSWTERPRTGVRAG